MLHERKRQLFADYKHSEAEYQRDLKQLRSRKRTESFKRRESARIAKEEAWQKEQ